MPHVTSIGLDVHARSVAAAAFNPFTGEVVHRDFGTDAAEIAEWALGFEEPRACYESGPTGFHMARELRALGLNDAELCIARNEPYARMGYSFRNPGLQAYFNARSWYHNKGWRGELPQDSAGYITAHNLLTIAESSSSAAQWLRLRTW